MKTELEKMLAGELYSAVDPQLSAMRRQARILFHQLNQSSDDQEALRRKILVDLLGAGGDTAWIEPPFYCDYGSNIHLGEKVYFNFNCTVLDVCEVHIGSGTMFAPCVQVYTATHPLDAKLRCSGQEFGKPIRIGSQCWIGGGSIICPGVTIGDRTVIGAGSVVTKDIPADVLAVGNPCRVIRKLL